MTHLMVALTRRDERAALAELRHDSAKKHALAPEPHSGERPIHVASEWAHPTITSELLHLGADPNARDRMKRTPLICLLEGNRAKQVDRARTVELLVSRGADVNLKRTPTASSPLHLAVLSDEPLVVECLLAYGADVTESRNRDAASPTHSSLSADVLKLLLDAGADPNSRTKNGSTPLMMITSKLQTRPNREAASMTKLLADAGASLAGSDDSGQSPLHLAAKTGSLDVLRTLLEAGADPNVQAIGYGTPLHMAVGFRKRDAVGLLLSKGADPNLSANGDRRGWTPLFEAANRGEQEIAIALIEAGASVDVTDRQGKRPADYARSAAIGALLRTPK